MLAEKVDERLLNVGRHARGLAAHKHGRLLLQKVPHCVAIHCDRLLHIRLWLAWLAGEGAHEFRNAPCLEGAPGFAFRSIPSPEKPAAAAYQYAKNLRMYFLSEAANPPQQRFVDPINDRYPRFRTTTSEYSRTPTRS